MERIESILAGVPVMAIFRDRDVEETLELAERAWSVGIDVVEVPIRTPDAIPVLEAVVAAGRERGRPVAAGTVTTPELAEAAGEAGAALTVSPGLDSRVLAASERAGMPHLAGVATPTEVLTAHALGLTWVKAFPAAALGASWFAAMRGPFPHIDFVATGGLDSGNVEAFLDAGARTAAVGSALADPEQLDALAEIVRRRRRERA